MRGDRPQGPAEVWLVLATGHPEAARVTVGEGNMTSLYSEKLVCGSHGSWVRSVEVTETRGGMLEIFDF